MQLFKNIIYLLFLPGIIFCQQSKSFQGNEFEAVLISNISGNIEVVESKNNSIQVDYTIGKGHEAFNIHFERIKDSLFVIVEHDTYYGPSHWDFSKSFPGNIRPGYLNMTDQPKKIDMKISLPKSTLLKVATINDGDLRIEGIDEVYAYNINGGITINEVREVRKVNTINGDVNVTFAANPKKSGRFYTLNGDLTVQLLKGLNSEFSFKSFNGDFYTDIEDLEILPKKIKKLTSKDKFKISIGEEKYMKVGNGNVPLHFETFNGDAIVKINK